MIDLAAIKHLIIDMDGVLWLGDQPMPALIEFFNILRALNIKFILATNNASKSGAEYVAKLAGFGAVVNLNEILTSPQATATYLAQHAPKARIFAIGEPGMTQELEGAGLVVVPHDNPADVTHVVVGWDRQLTYRKLADACLLIRAGAVFIGTNPDVTYPSERGIIPGNGAILAALRTATDIEPIIIGKPQTEMMIQAMQRMGSTPANTAVLGDRLETDILGGERAGLTTILVLSGVTNRAEALKSPIKADYIFEDIHEIGAELTRVQATSRI